MAKTKRQRLSIITPIGIAAWPSLDRPDTRNDPDGVYNVDIVLPPNDPGLVKLHEDLKDFGERARVDTGAPADAPMKISIANHKNKEGKETGNKIIRCKQKAAYRDKNNPQLPPVVKSIGIVDSNKDPIIPVPRIGSGSKLRVIGYASANYVQGIQYVSVKIHGVQLIEFVEIGAFGRGDEYGLEAVEGGYVAGDHLVGAAAQTQVKVTTTEPGTVGEKPADGPDF